LAERVHLYAVRVAGLPRVVLELHLGEFEGRRVDNGLVLAREYLVADPDLPGIEDVAEQFVDVAPA
jgi:hypothetical protein